LILKSAKFSTILMMAAAVSALLAIALHGQSLSRPLAERGDALVRHAESLGSEPVALMTQVAEMNAESLVKFRQLVGAGMPPDVAQRFNSAFPVYGDGTRRSTDSLFDGVELDDGSWVNGVGAYIGDADQMSDTQEFWFWAGFEAIRSLGPEYVERGSSLYYFTPDRRMVMYAPHRDDRLEFYRYNAPADFDLRADEDPILFGAHTNPDRALQCTRLSYFISSEGGQRSAMACRTPVWQGNVLLGAFGSSFEVGHVLAGATSELPAGGAVWILNALGQVIARNSDRRDGEREFNPETLAPRLLNPSEVQLERIGSAMFAMVPIPHANWTLVVKTPLQDLIDRARLRSLAIFFVLFGLFALLGGMRSGHILGCRAAGAIDPEPRTE